MARSSLACTSSSTTTCCGLFSAISVSRCFASMPSRNSSRLSPLSEAARARWSSGGILRISLIRWSGGRSRICSALRSAYSPLLAAACAFIICEPCFSRGHSCISTSLFALLFLFKALQLCFVNSAFGWIGGKRLLALRNRFDHLLGRKILDNIAGMHAEREQWRKARLESMVIDFVGMQLLVYPLF